MAGPSKPKDPALRAFVSCLLVGLSCAVLSLLVPLHASGADTWPGRYGAAVFACRSTLDLREVDWMAAAAAEGELPYFVARTTDGSVSSVFGPMPALLGAPFMEGLEPGTVVTDLEIERRARHASALAVALAAILLSAALSARAPPITAAALALVTALSFAGVPTLGQGLWQQTALLVPFTAAMATLAWASWRGGLLLALTPSLLAVAALTRPNAAILVLVLGYAWLETIRREPAWRRLVAAALPLLVLSALPQLAWNAATSGDPLGIHAYVAAHTDHAVVMGLGPKAFLTGLSGLLVSPARGLLFYAPAVLLALYVAFRRGDRIAKVIGVGIVLHLFVVAAYRQWWGGWVFGPRMLAEVVWLSPLLLVRVPLEGALRKAVLVTGAVTLAVGVLGSFRYELGVWDLRRNPDLHNDALWDLGDSPVVAMLRGRGVPTIDAPQGPFAYCVGEPAIQSLRRAPGP